VRRSGAVEESPRADRKPARNPCRSAAKRLTDIAVAAVALTLLAPVILVLAIVVALALGRPVLFRQQRPGLHGRPFTILKFRTMTDARGPDGSLLPDEERLPPFGVWLRSTSLDELPALWNVLRGDMSLVGPRPLVMQYLERYSKQQARRHLMRPGVTGWAQVNGRNSLSWEDKFKLDVWYVDNWTYLLDLKILLATVHAVFNGDGIAADGSATMPEFQGSQIKDVHSPDA
jgi:lipopolysaccharide/colanic/teichoic acid biosynthesis glycosyltransferase